MRRSGSPSPRSTIGGADASETGANACTSGITRNFIVACPYSGGRAADRGIERARCHPDLSYEHRWKGPRADRVDNRCVMHRATSYDASRRAGDTALYGLGEVPN